MSLLHRSRTALLVTVALASSAAFAGADSPLPPDARMASAAPAAAGAHKMVSDTINWATASGIGLNAGFTNLDAPTVIKCNNAAGCTFSIAAMVQLAPGSGALWAICSLVDGTYANPGCPYQGVTPGAGSYVTGNWRGNIAVGSGSHTLQTQVYVSVASTLGEWQVDYGLFKP